jgi:Matrixin
MRKLSVLALGAVAAFAMSTLASAAPGGNGDGGPPLPPGAIQVSENVYYLGKKKVDGVELEGYAFVLRAKAHSAKGRGPTGGTKPGRGSCYQLIGYPAWTSAEPWYVNTSNAPVSSMQSSMDAGIGAWESASGADIFGSGSPDNSAHANTTADGKNVVEFGNAGGGGIVAVTYVWGSRRTAIFEWDMIFGSNWGWSNGGSSTTFDFLDVATHELGHAAGLDHPANACTEETMYAYVDFGETKKRDLNAGDIDGINALY